jgi:UDP-N-acetylmuramate: L-alanyl-gamma-D-glutamyl-meso-diaminopimelate ligase
METNVCPEPDPHRNRIPEFVESVHFIAICGTAMGALASMLRDLGIQVTGSDQNVYPPMSTFLADRGIPVTSGFAAGNLAHGPDLVVVGNTVGKDNPEVKAMQAMGLSFCSMPQAVNRFAAAGKKTLVVTGTHGKTTTSSLLAWVLHSAGLDPSFMIGGILKNFSSNYRLGQGDFMVVEGDEYDTAFFDKGPKFLHYRPSSAILTSVEFDHADIYRDLDHVMQAFERFVEAMPPESRLVAHDADRNIDALVRGCEGRVCRYGENEDSSWRIGSVRIDPPWTDFDVYRDGGLFHRFRSPLVGRHNRLNALAVIAVCTDLGVGPERIARGLSTFAGIRRRQEVRGVKREVTVMDDFAHHPTAVRETVQAVRPFYPAGRLIAVFEPRTNSSMRDVFQDVYPTVFDGADLVCVREPSLLHKIPAGQRFSSLKLVSDLKRRGLDAHFFQETGAIIEFVADRAAPGDLVLIMSNGGFDNIHRRLLDRLSCDTDRQVLPSH